MDVTVDLPDTTLWDLAGAGDGEAFGQLFARHATAVYHLHKPGQYQVTPYDATGGVVEDSTRVTAS